ncbi:MAG: DNA polymerase III subunit [Syntrophorhabdales bacterium]|jgi:DNA polymerase-3 subunit delta'
MEFNTVGHDHQKRVLSSLVERGKLPHALLFAGPGGVGKRTIAVELIKNLFCAEGRACGTCRGCRGIEAGLHPDFTFVAGEGPIKIDGMRAIRKDVYEPPYEAQLRAILIDNAELMTHEAANALLKTLEEPPPSNLFVLVSSREREIPQTVRSRCMRVGFGPLSTETVRAYFQHALNLDSVKAAAFAAMSNGSIASGLFWMDEENYRTRQGIAELVMGAKRPFAKAAVLAERMTAKEHEMEYLSFLLSLFRDVWWLNHTGDVSGLFNRDLARIMGGAAEGGAAWAESSITRIQEMMRTLRYNVNRWLALENLMVNIVRPS